MDYSRNYTIEDIAQMEGHVEMISGHVLIIDKTSTTHNLAVSLIAQAVREHIRNKGGNCTVFTENVALYCNELSGGDQDNYFLPDVMTVCDPSSIDEDGVHAVPLFVAEITSESTRRFDYEDKMMVYRNIGVEEYWVVDIQKKVITKYLQSDDFVPEVYLHPEAVKVSVYPGLTIDVSEYMR
ncbi:MAG: Uma2 family endonuclease [Lachnospiraceae bacterium]|nr:Uma2 family endonuclease [Lachnospiraceae bacterium]